ncbi:MAG: bifunctional diguanylate cyclase/phosphodiesterase [Campylobacterales bacterium]|nr:bifunctional diguanylate cyclase/phosphodiesterase [Campylobacterales bacterium]
MEFELLEMFIVVCLSFLIVFFLWKRNALLKGRIANQLNAFQRAFDMSDDAIIILSDNFEIIYMNHASKGLFKFNKDNKKEIFANNLKIKIKDEWFPLDEFIKKYIQLRDSFSFANTKITITDVKEELSVNLSFEKIEPSSSIKSDKKKGERYIVSIHDLRKENELYNATFYHDLTKLPNQDRAIADLNVLFAKSHLHNQKLALLMINIDNFSRLRSILGYQQADKILIKFANYLDEFCKENSYNVYNTLYNTFLLIIPSLSKIEEAEEIAQKIQKQLVSFFSMSDAKLYLTASIGISVYPDSGPTRNLLDNAYKALYSAENKGQGKIEIYQSDSIQKEYDELVLYNDLPDAFEKKQFEVYYQPIVHAQSKEIVSAEALIRWKHPRYGLIAPYIFIPMLEKTGLIVKLGKYMLETILKQQKHWELFKFKRISISMNVSIIEFETEGFVDFIAKKLAENKIIPDLIKFEVTEGMAAMNETRINHTFQELKKLGVGISLDDFGTGYTSFSYLKKIPAEIVKIDKSLVDNILKNKEDQRIVKAIIELAHTLGMKVVVEGVEDQFMAELLASYRCDYMQGYHFAKPLPLFEFQELLR